MPLETEVDVVQPAGRYLARIQDAGRRQELVVHDLASGGELLRVRHRSIGDLDIAADGTVALTYATEPRHALPARRAASRNTPGCGRSTATSPPAASHSPAPACSTRDTTAATSARACCCAALDGGVRRLATFTPRRRRAGDLDLAPNRAVWAAQKMRSADYEAKPSGPARIVSRPL